MKTQTQTQTLLTNFVNKEMTKLKNKVASLQDVALKVEEVLSGNLNKIEMDIEKTAIHFYCDNINIVSWEDLKQCRLLNSYDIIVVDVYKSFIHQQYIITVKNLTK